MIILRVALDVPLNRLFDYLAPVTERAEPEAGVPETGMRVRVPFGRNVMIGVVMEVTTYSAIPAEKLRHALHIFRDVPPLSRTLLDLFRFCSAYYHHPLGEVVLNGLPGRLRVGKPYIRNPPAISRYQLTPEGRAADLSAIPARSVKYRLLAKLASETMDMRQARQFSRRAPQVLKELVTLGWAAEMEDDTPGLAPAVAPPIMPTVAQQSAIAAIASKISQFNTWLLHGVTGSGKTEIYLQLIALQLSRGRQSLVLVPEINLTPQLEEIFRTRFPSVRLTSLHSGLNPTERTNGWLQAQQGDAKIILGTRLAVFTPLPRLGLMIVDEEHDTSFKQQEGLRYSARDVAIFRARQADVSIVLGSATPSLDSYYNAIKGRYHLLRLPSRAATNAMLPSVRCIDMRIEKKSENFSAAVIAALERCVAHRQQSLVFLNRRGYAPVLLCKSCGWAAACHRCASRLVVHLRERKLRCHHCGYQEGFPVHCPECGNQDITPFGHGTQRVEAELAQRLPHARITRIDRDSTSRKDAWPRMLRDIREQRVDILVGTQILAKGHDFPNLSLVAILNSDASLFSTEFRASERLFAQLMQVAGRAGRAGIPGEVLVQTEFPDHPLYQALRHHDYDSLARMLLEERKAAMLPPFVYQALLRAEAPKMATALDFLARAATIAPPMQQIEIFDPVPAQMARLKGMERAHLLVQSSSRAKLQAFLAGWRVQLDKLSDRTVRWTLDVDPLEF